MKMPWFGNSSDGLLLDFSTRPDMRNSPIWEWWKSTEPRKQFVSATLNSNKTSGQTWQWQLKKKSRVIYRYSNLRPIWPIDSRWFPSHVLMTMEAVPAIWKHRAASSDGICLLPWQMANYRGSNTKTHRGAQQKEYKFDWSLKCKRKWFDVVYTLLTVYVYIHCIYHMYCI